MEKTALKDVQALAMKKQKVYDQSLIRYLVRAMLASAFIGFGVIIAFKSGNYFYAVDNPIAYPLAAFTFGAAIIMIAYGGGDLFTGNTFYFTYAALNKQMRWSKVGKMWAATYIGNLIGALLFAYFIYLTGLFESNAFLAHVAEAKMNASTSELFFRSILCNWLVCMAFYIPMTLKGDGPKLFTMIFFVFGFFISSYEHSIANMSTFSIALIGEHPETVSVAKAIANIIPVTIGNMIGGALFMGVLYKWLNSPSSTEEDGEDKDGDRSTTEETPTVVNIMETGQNK